MKQRYEVYQPSKLIQDFYTAPAYYRAKDVNWSPFTPVGKLSRTADDQPGQHLRLLIATAGKPKRPPVFPAGFSLNGPSHSRTEAVPKTSATANGYKNIVAFFSTLGAYIVGAAHAMRHVRFAPKKYTAEHGWRVDFSSSIFAFAKLSVVSLLALALIAWSIVHTKTDTPQPTQPANKTASKPVVISPAANHIAAMAAAAPSQTTAGNSRVYTPSAWASTVTSSAPNSTSVVSSTATNTGSNTTATTDPSTPTDTTTTTSSTPTTSGSGDSGSTTSTGDGTGTTSGSGSSTGSGDSSSGTLPTVPVTVPGVSVNVGSQPVVSTDSTTLSL